MSRTATVPCPVPAWPAEPEDVGALGRLVHGEELRIAGGFQPVLSAREVRHGVAMSLLKFGLATPTHRGTRIKATRLGHEAMRWAEAVRRG